MAATANKMQLIFAHFIGCHASMIARLKMTAETYFLNAE